MNGGASTYRHTIRANGRVIMIREATTGGHTHKYLHRDHLGSVTAITDESTGTVHERLSYDAWGLRRNATSWAAGSVTATEHRGYTGHEHLDDIGVIHMNGRIYSPSLGRMLSPDPITKSLNKGQNYNRYTYVFNNPLRYTDPSGYARQSVGKKRRDGWGSRHVGTTYTNDIGGSSGQSGGGGPDVAEEVVVTGKSSASSTVGGNSISSMAGLTAPPAATAGDSLGNDGAVIAPNEQSTDKTESDNDEDLTLGGIVSTAGAVFDEVTGSNVGGFVITIVYEFGTGGSTEEVIIAGAGAFVGIAVGVISGGGLVVTVGTGLLVNIIFNEITSDNEAVDGA